MCYHLFSLCPTNEDAQKACAIDVGRGLETHGKREYWVCKYTGIPSANFSTLVY